MTTDTTEDPTSTAADAAMAVFDRALHLMAPPRHVVAEALAAAAGVYTAAYGAELDRLVAKAQLAGLNIEGRDVAIRFRHAHEVLQGVVDAFDGLFTVHAAAENYVEVDAAASGPAWTEQDTTFTDPARMAAIEADRPVEEWPPYRRYHVIVVKPGGKSPHELRKEYEQRAERAEARIAAALALIEGGMPVGPRNLRTVLTDVECSCSMYNGEPDWDPDCPRHGQAPINPAAMGELLGQAREATHWTMGAWVDVIEQAPGGRTHYDGMLANVIRAVLDRLDEPAVPAAGK